MLAQRQEFHMGKIVLKKIGKKLFSKFPISEPAAIPVAPPGTRVHLIDRNRPVISLIPRSHPLFVLKRIQKSLCQSGGRARSYLRAESKWICLIQHPAVLLINPEFIQHSGQSILVHGSSPFGIP